MWLVIGGAAQGKRAWALGEVRCPEEAVHDGGALPLSAAPAGVRILDRLHLLTRRLLAEGGNPEDYVESLLAASPDAVILCDEIGCGIVPMDAFEREWRERTGRLLCALAARAQRVVRVLCGVPQTLRQRLAVALIRHGRTQGNLCARYNGGATDEPLCEAGADGLRALAAKGIYPRAQRLFVSPMRRARETARILYPDLPQEVREGLRECAFGAFENRTHEELCGLPLYQAWLDARGEEAFPGGESPQGFSARSVEAFGRIVEESFAAGLACAVVVAHGGTVMAVLQHFKGGGLYDWRVENGGGYVLHFERGAGARGPALERIETGEGEP